MVDWKYGLVCLLWWVPAVLGWDLLFGTNGQLTSNIGVVLLLIFFVSGIFIYGKKSPYQRKNRRPTVKYFAAIFRIVFMVILLSLIWSLPNKEADYTLFDFIFPFFLALFDIVPCFFTESKFNKKETSAD